MPSRSTLIRWGGLAAIATGALYVLGALSAVPENPLTSLFMPLNLSAVWGIPMLLLTVGALVGLHARQVGSPGYGLLGTAGFLLAAVGMLLARALGPLVFSGVPTEVSPSMVGMVITGAVTAAAELGMLLLGMATLRAAVLPLPWRGLPLAIFLLGVLLTTLVGTLFPARISVSVLIYAQPPLVGLGWALLGYALWSGIGEAARHRPVRVR